MSLALHSLFGLAIRSELALGDMPRAAADAAPDVSIRLGRIALGEHPGGYAVTADGTLLTVPKVGRYLIRHGDEILVEAAPGASERNLRLFLLGSAFGALLHQRGLLPLHANAIEVDGCAIAFSGHSGAGKSTLAAWFHDRGHRILADDVCVIGFGDGGTPLAFPGIPRLRLWREALEASGRATAQYDRSFDDTDKYDVPTGGASSGVGSSDRDSSGEEAAVPLKLSAIYLLRQAEGESAAITRLEGVDRVETLVSNTYRGGYLKAISRTGEHLAACLKVARAVPVFRAGRLWGFDRFEEQALLLESHARAQVGASTAE